jgi:large subunit ribosomal protein L21
MHFYFQPFLSAVRHPYSINGLPLSDTPAKPEDLFAVVEFSGTQYKVTLGDVLIADKMEDIDIESKITFSKVMLVGSRKATLIGRPYVEGVEVIGTVEEMVKDRKVIIFKTRRYY